MIDKKRILIADDDRNVRKLLTIQLDRAGYEVILADNGLEAIRMLRAMPQPPDLILLDLLMPMYSGLDVLEKLKETSPTIPVMLMSAVELPIARQVVVLSNPIPYLVKPFELPVLLKKIETLLQPVSVID
ncbi:response regulator [Larkinella terrae]|nr:response regulator [Larkinella terrae]